MIFGGQKIKPENGNWRENHHKLEIFQNHFKFRKSNLGIRLVPYDGSRVKLETYQSRSEIKNSRFPDLGVRFSLFVVVMFST